MITANNVLQHEFIGQNVAIEHADNTSLTGIAGKIVDETRNMFVIDTPRGEKNVLKKGIQIRMRVDSQEILVNGDALVGRPEDRIKK